MIRRNGIKYHSKWEVFLRLAKALAAASVIDIVLSGDMWWPCEKSAVIYIKKIPAKESEKGIRLLRIKRKRLPFNRHTRTHFSLVKTVSFLTGADRNAVKSVRAVSHLAETITTLHLNQFILIIAHFHLFHV
jgi:hypothetical protein